ncbi:MAG: DNA helicase RecQ [Candidatus Moraniibacteriota bacterium]|nr:MAG: DNA helicase RecQ [Candidatus Moranbacteria bacterium]
MSTPLHILKTQFGFESFREHQEAIIEAVLAGKDAFVLMPTGGGKSLCYQIPALLLPHVTVVVSPLIALMKDQVEVLRVAGVAAEYLNSSLSMDEQDRVLASLARGKTKLLYIAPERLFGASSLVPFLQEVGVSLFAVDEAHCISSWGHDFRPEYRFLSDLKKFFSGTPTLALTATADNLTSRDIIERLALRSPVCFQSSFDRPNIRYAIEPKAKSFDRLLRYLSARRGDSGIIYTLSRKSADSVAKRLADAGFSALPYHAGLDAAVRDRHQQKFLRDETKIVVATIAFGMGINKSNVRFVVHMDLPKNIESYYQETGRAGRDGLPSEALLFYSPADVRKLARFAKVDGNEEQSAVMLRKLKQLADLCEASVCRRHLLLRYFGESSPQSCDACDVCLSEQTTFDGTLIAQKLLSAVFRLHERFGLGYTIDVLRGSKSEKIRPEHRVLKTFGAGADISRELWFRYAKDLIALGFLRQAGEPYPTLSLTEKSAAVLRGEIRVMLTALADNTKREVKSEAPEYEATLFDQLKALRTEYARKENVPPYIIFSDATLLELATFLPTNISELPRISGFGEVKTRRYGKAFLNVVAKYCAEHNLLSRMSEKVSARSRRSRRR